MNAEPILANIAETFQEHRLEVILVGNAAAALQGAPVTTLDFDFMFRKTPLNIKRFWNGVDARGGPDGYHPKQTRFGTPQGFGRPRHSPKDVE